jgi:hypothetical protein
MHHAADDMPCKEVKQGEIICGVASAYHEQGRRGSGSSLLELLLAVVVDEDVQRQDVPPGLLGVVVQRRHGRVVDGQHGDGLPPVDVVGQPRLAQHRVELGEFLVRLQDLGDVVLARRGGRRRHRQERSGRQCEGQEDGWSASRHRRFVRTAVAVLADERDRDRGVQL